jgi:uncharacterized protein (TIGR03435 family)
MSERALIALMVAAAAAAQTASPADKRFEVVSVKPDSPNNIPNGCNFASVTFSSPVEFAVERCSLGSLIRAAYARVTKHPIVGIPRWAESAWYSISAKSASPASLPEKYLMLRPVLEERFHLKWHRETRQMPVYYLSVDGTLKLQKTVPGSCRTWDPMADMPAPDTNQPPLCQVWMDRLLTDGGQTFEAKGVTLAQLAANVGRKLGREGLDSTGSKDLFDIDLEFANPELGSAGESAGETAPAAPMPAGSTGKKAPAPASGPSEHPSLLAALKNVGLTVKAGRGPVEVFVVDSVQRPSAN